MEWLPEVQPQSVGFDPSVLYSAHASELALSQIFKAFRTITQA